jgi:hypothetical protein
MFKPNMKSSRRLFTVGGQPPRSRQTSLLQTPFMVVLGPNAENLKHTRDWVVWESGNASGANKDVWVIEAFEDSPHLSVVIPHLRHYISFHYNDQWLAYFRHRFIVRRFARCKGDLSWCWNRLCIWPRRCIDRERRWPVAWSGQYSTETHRDFVGLPSMLLGVLHSCWSCSASVSSMQHTNSI